LAKGEGASAPLPPLVAPLVSKFMFWLQISLTIARLELSAQKDYTCQFFVSRKANAFLTTSLDNLVIGNPNRGNCLFYHNSDDIIPNNSGKVL